MDNPRPYAGRRIISRAKPPTLLRLTRTRARRSLRWLANEVGCTAQFLSDCETRAMGHRIPLPRLLQIAAALEVDPTPLVIDEGLVAGYLAHLVGARSVTDPKLVIRAARVLSSVNVAQLEAWVSSYDGGGNVASGED